ncbi:MAG: glycosyltransferase, partial [Deltaproteobacteria bacterium]
MSIIVPTYNEVALIQAFLLQLRDRAPDAEIIVVDGGSSDGTREQARELCDRLIVANRGRAKQMNAGAAAASGRT